jgi:general secretion pathway protein D
LEEASISLDKAIRINLQQVRLATLLELMLDELELTYVEKDELLIVTTPEDAEATLLIRVYDCRDLLAMEAPPGSDQFVPVPRQARSGGMFSVEDTGAAGQAANPAAQPGGFGSGGGLGGSMSSGRQGELGGGSDEQSSRPMTLHDVRAEQLMDIIMTNVDPQTWDDVGGPGSISEYNGLVVVTQTAQTHKKVERVLDMLREAAGLEVPKAGKVVR